MNKILNIYKPLGLTPFQLIQRLRVLKPEYADVKIGFAGRLDPLANGVMLLMIGDATKNRDKYLNLDKEYEFEVLFGASTDTYDTLGTLNYKTIQQFSNLANDLEKKIKHFITIKLGKHVQSYPPYSSKTVDGKPLYWYARNNKISEIKIPTRDIQIYDFDLLDIKKVNIEKLKKIIITNINLVDGDFRQKEILENWNKFFKENETKVFQVAKFRISCSSGTYVRSLANEMGDIFGTGAIALSISRTRAGEYKIENSLRL